MAYTPLDWKELCEIVNELKKYSDVNPKRLSFIALYDQLTNQISKTTDFPEKIVNVLTGALVFAMADIKFAEYYGASPQKKIGWIWSSGSEVYTIIKNKGKLVSKTNQLGYDERLFYINEFYKYMNIIYQEQDFDELKKHTFLKKKNLIWKNKKELCDHIYSTIDPILKKNSEDLYNLVHGVPILSGLVRNLQKLEAEYIASSRNPTNPKRLETLNFIKFILQSCQESNLTENSWHVCAGVALVALMQIDSEYIILSPTRSKLFQKCLQALNQESLNKIPIDDKIKWLRSISIHLITIFKNENKYSEIINKVIQNATNSALDKNTFDKQIKEFQSRIEDYLALLEEQKKTPSNTNYAISTGASFAVQYLGGPVAAQVAKDVVIGGISMGGYLVAGPVGSALFGVTGTFIMSSLGHLVTQGLIDSASASLFAWILEKIY